MRSIDSMGNCMWNGKRQVYPFYSFYTLALCPRFLVSIWFLCWWAAFLLMTAKRNDAKTNGAQEIHELKLSLLFFGNYRIHSPNLVSIERKISSPPPLGDRCDSLARFMQFKSFQHALRLSIWNSIMSILHRIVDGHCNMTNIVCILLSLPLPPSLSLLFPSPAFSLFVSMKHTKCGFN